MMPNTATMIPHLESFQHLFMLALFSFIIILGGLAIITFVFCYLIADFNKQDDKKQNRHRIHLPFRNKRG